MFQGKDGNPKDSLAQNKVPLWLLSPVAKAKWALAQFCGALKYGAWNWRVSGVRASVYISAMQRHLDAYTSGQEYDIADGTDHLGAVMACAAILLDAKEAGKLTDDRPPRVELAECYGECELLAACLIDKYSGRDPRHYTIADAVVVEDEEVCPPTLPSGQWPEATDKSEFRAVQSWKSGVGFEVEVVDDYDVDEFGYVHDKSWR